MVTFNGSLYATTAAKNGITDDLCRGLIVSAPGMNIRLSELGRELTGKIDGPFHRLACCRYYGSLEKCLRNSGFSIIAGVVWPRYEDICSLITAAVLKENIMSIRKLENEHLGSIMSQHPTSRFATLT